MRILYEEGPERVWMGPHEFNRGEAKEVEDGLAKQIMGKGTIKFKAEAKPAPAKAAEIKGKGGNE